MWVGHRLCATHWMHQNLQCIGKVLTVLHLFYILSCYSLISKLIKFMCHLKTLVKRAHSEKVKKVCLKFLQI